MVQTQLIQKTVISLPAPNPGGQCLVFYTVFIPNLELLASICIEPQNMIGIAIPVGTLLPGRPGWLEARR